MTDRTDKTTRSEALWPIGHRTNMQRFIDGFYIHKRYLSKDPFSDSAGHRGPTAGQSRGGPAPQPSLRGATGRGKQQPV